MFDHNHYVPIIKWKRGERNALKHLDKDVKANMTPLLEIQPVPYDAIKEEFEKTLDQYLDGIGKKASECLLTNHPLFLDVSTLYNNVEFDPLTLLQGDIHPVQHIVKDFEAYDIPVIPVTGILRYDEFHEAIKSVVSEFERGVCLRITREELQDLEQLEEDLEAQLEFLSLSPSEVDIVLDYQFISGVKAKELTNQIVMCLSQFPNLTTWRSLTLCGTSFPPTISQIPTKSNGSIVRKDWKVYKKLRRLNLPRVPAYGDYTITNPNFTIFNPKTMKMAADIKYTVDGEFLIFRGKIISGNGFDQMQDLCKDVLANSKYRGKDFSHGDQYIFKCAQGTAKNGNKETWVTVGVNHHLTQVVSDLSILADS